MITSFTDLAQASGVCRKWKQGVKQALARRQTLSFAGFKMDDDSTARLVHHAYSLKELDIENPWIFSSFGIVSQLASIDAFHDSSRSRWGCQITDNGLCQISLAKCVSSLTSISLWGITGITDKGVVKLITRANSLQHLNVGGTFITDESLSAIADSCPRLKSIVLWSCRQVTETGLFVIVSKCRKLESINVWGTRVPLDCFIGLLTIRPALQIKPQGLPLNVMLPVV
ncbi:hypothetical protein Gotri_023615 [Gossypium trilobum]|uniref:F-box/LRR-repeat protein 15-like leucin rich repeat domain-containing protein n=1 Tax=Gossypium trilobum TaxID=34281 RepID=A0A7J9DJL0_9ROSI|nr:hypothetical protein [Gossypium trilobum]